MINQLEIESAVYDAIRKTINRFRENPLYTFTESDLHSYLHADILAGNSELFYERVGNYNFSLVHLEYPTNFRYKKAALLEGYRDLTQTNFQTHFTAINKGYGYRGNFDLTVLNKEFLSKVDTCIGSFDNNRLKYEYANSLPYHIVNKKIEAALTRIEASDYMQSKDGNPCAIFYREVMYAIEFKYIHTFNARHINMIEEVIQDNEKLRLAHIHSNGFIKPINLVFCSSEAKVRSDKAQPIIKRISTAVNMGKFEHKGRVHEIPEGVLMIFIESYFSSSKKNTEKPIAFSPKPAQWMNDLCHKIGINCNMKR